MINFEVLSPVGNAETLVAAVRSGADAVYLGLEGFNARRNAKNFTKDQLAEAIRFCHLRNVKVYLTLNTLVCDGEFQVALETARVAVKAGIDAFIVQDLGLARLLRDSFPNTPLHASTQMSVCNFKALKNLKELGFCRVVAAREMDKNSLISLCEEAKRLQMEVEVFVHGALCMCMSGQCYLSSMLGGRSGNRGLCAQPCRLDFAVEGGTGKDLSLKDLSLVDFIPQLKEIGVTSFKIEGRMKREEYVAAATAVCREVVDTGHISPEKQRLLQDIFSRNGFTDGYYTNKLGVNMFGFRTEENQKLSSLTERNVHDLYRRERQNVPIKCDALIKADNPIFVRFSVGDIVAEINGDVPEKAKVKETDKTFVEEKLSKLGGTVYYIEEINCEIDGGLAVSGAVLNKIKQQLCEELDSKRLQKISAVENLNYSIKEITPKNTTPKTFLRFKNVSQIPDNVVADMIILDLEADLDGLKEFADKIAIAVEIPRGIMSNSKIKQTVAKLEYARSIGVEYAVCDNVSAVDIAKEAELKVIGGFGLNIYNSESLITAKDMGAEMAILSFEMSLSDAKKINNVIPRGVISYGHLPLMIFRNCPGKNRADGCKTCNGNCTLTDRKGVVFPVNCRAEFSEMYNSRPLYLADVKHNLTGLDFEVIYFTNETKQKCEEILESYKKGYKPLGEYTRGLYFREVF